ncbi:coiled-coil domain-containing protein 68 [Tupaia chinensis]|uniref:coiled-coil domain-containing protein 68 n=1 Tax=Tupaia chinensis TaxID=246437 RepID=UPI000FFB6ECB|nr:coiled-coil domain-containing protein 68 [Tupaia chinensis]
MTSITVTTEVSPRGKIEDNSALYESIPAHIIEETEYVKKIRTTLEKIRNQMFKDEVGRGSTNHKLDTKCCGNIQNGAESEMEPSCCSVNSLMEKMKGKDLQLLEINKENEVLKIKLEASREAGAAALRNVAQRLFENYQTQSEEARKKHEDSKHILQVNKLEKEQELKQNVENLNQVAEKLEEKHSQITELENLVQRMEKEKRLLLERKLSLENKLLQLKSNHTCAKSRQDLQMEISILQEQISHLQFVIHSQHQNLRSVIQEMDVLKNNLKEQDKRIENLKEKVNILEFQLQSEAGSAASSQEVQRRPAQVRVTPRTSQAPPPQLHCLLRVTPSTCIKWLITDCLHMVTFFTLSLAISVFCLLSDCQCCLVLRSTKVL